MDVVIVADLAGASQIGSQQKTWTCHKHEDCKTHGSYAITRDVYAAIAGAIRAGAQSFKVVDTGISAIRLDALPPNATLYDSSQLTSVLETVASSGEQACLFLVGFCARAGTDNALFPHTFHGITDVILNGMAVGEIGIVAALAQHYGIPLTYISGDQAAVDEARALQPQCCTAVVKRRVGERELLLAIEQSTATISAAAECAVKRRLTYPDKGEENVVRAEIKPCRPEILDSIEIEGATLGRDAIFMESTTLPEVYRAIMQIRTACCGTTP